MNKKPMKPVIIPIILKKLKYLLIGAVIGITVAVVVYLAWPPSDKVAETHTPGARVASKQLASEETPAAAHSEMVTVPTVAATQSTDAKVKVSEPMSLTKVRASQPFLVEGKCLQANREWGVWSSIGELTACPLAEATLLSTLTDLPEGLYVNPVGATLTNGIYNENWKEGLRDPAPEHQWVCSVKNDRRASDYPKSLVSVYRVFLYSGQEFKTGDVGRCYEASQAETSMVAQYLLAQVNLSVEGDLYYEVTIDGISGNWLGNKPFSVLP